jgi:hypothetical protein
MIMAEESKPYAGGENQAATDSDQEASQSNASGSSAESADFCLPELNFSTFVISLNASALVHLGVIDDPATGKKAKQLAMAKQTIDTLSMLEKKTKGNLTKDEQDMLQNILYDLRIIYVREMG